MAGAPPWKGTWRMSTPARWLNISPARWEAVPTPPDAKLIFLLSRLARARYSCRVFTPSSGRTISTLGNTAAMDTGARSRCGSCVIFIMWRLMAREPMDASSSCKSGCPVRRTCLR